MRRWRRAGALVCLAATVAACSSGAADRVAVANDVPVATPSPLVPLPTVDTTPPTAATTSAAEPATTAPSTTNAASATTEPAVGVVELGEWDWGIPCRVPVTQSMSGFPENIRTFDMELTESVDGSSIDVRFENIEYPTPSGSAMEVVSQFTQSLDLLPDMRLDELGRVVDVASLAPVVAERAELAGWGLSESQVAFIADDPFTQTQSVDLSINSWFGFWSDVDSLPVGRSDGPGRTLRVGDIAYSSTAIVSAYPDAGFASALIDDAAAVSLGRLEFFDDVATRAEAWPGLVSRSLSVTSVLEPASRRTIEVRSTETGEYGDEPIESYQIQRRTTFDWANAEGCT